MRFLILAVALAFTASPALGQFRPEIPQWAEQGNALDQNHFGLMYDLDWDVPQDDTEDVRWSNYSPPPRAHTLADVGI